MSHCRVIDSKQPSPASAKTEFRLSVILVNFNGRDYLSSGLPILRNSVDSSTEIIVVDNASTDGSFELLEENFPYVRVIRQPSNVGYGVSNNMAARVASGRILVFLNPDVYIASGWLDPLLNTLMSDPSIGLATPKVMMLKRPDQVNTGGNDVHITGLTLCRGMGMSSHQLNDLTDVSAVSGAAFAIRRELFEELNGFDADYFLYMEDTDLSWRARLLGYRCLYVPKSIVFHDYKLSFNSRKIYLQERNRYQMLLKNLRWRTLLVLLPALLIAELITWSFILTRETVSWKEKVDAYLWVVRNWRMIMEKRKQVQASRKIDDRELILLTTSRLSFEQTASGIVPKLAHFCFDPFFAFFRWLSLSLIQW